MTNQPDIPTAGEIQQLARFSEDRRTLARPGKAADLRRGDTDIQIVRLVQQLFVAVESAPKVMVLAGVEPKSGCTWVCARMVEILTANLRASVCLVDATLRPAPASAAVNPGGGVSRQGEDWSLVPIRRAQQSPDRNLWMLSNTSATTGWYTRSIADRFQARLSELSKTFDYVLIDSPPITQHADATLLGRMADGLVMVLQAHRTRREAALRAQATLQASGVRIVGAVLNKRTFPIPDWLYRRL